MRNWTPEERAKQAALCRRHRPWTNSSGPKTAAGKKTSSRNSRKHGLRSRDLQEFNTILRAYNLLRKTISEQAVDDE